MSALAIATGIKGREECGNGGREARLDHDGFPCRWPLVTEALVPGCPMAGILRYGLDTDQSVSCRARLKKESGAKREPRAR
jgi:hypothetical protein